ncbi:lipopolysaccharide heptosyltransferase II [Trichloromonas acetexigens]|uniref:lipopolysaccharide heptosyltransferase II n=1 Tax=Trichloromonas acetexigens TaxID=38815 RepID=UPI0023F2F215|nr:lipopolysaccharide heptosyltransferase II [Desulfuromonas acetexigens]
MNRLEIKRILLRSTNWIGDAVMTTPAMGVVRRYFPDAEIVVAANPLVAQLFSHHPDCDRVLVYDRKGAHQGPGGFFKFVGELRRERFDLAILLQNAVEAAILATLAGIPRRAGYRSDGRGLLLSHGVPVGAAEKRLHHTDYYLRMLSGVGIVGETGPLQLACTAEEIAEAEARLGGGQWLAVNPGAAYGSAKRWIPQRFAEVADRLAETHGLRVLLTGGPGEIEIGRDIAQAMTHQPLNLIGQTQVREMMALLSRCRLMITNDSGPMHVAAAFGVPLVAVFGPTDHTTTSPLSERSRIVCKPVDCAPCLLRQCPTDHRCMEAIEVADVLAAAEELLKG